MEHLNKILADSAKHGFILGIALIIYTVLFYVSGIHMFSIMFGILSLVIVLGGQIAYALIYEKKFRDSIGGKISFLQLLVFGFVLLMVATLLSSVFNYVLYNLIDPEYLNIQIEYFAEDMSSFIPEEQMEKTLVDMEEKVVEIRDIGASLMKAWIAPLVISLLLALIVKKDINE
jgi:uncharacterized membrane protein (DUF106 family)